MFLVFFMLNFWVFFKIFDQKFLSDFSFLILVFLTFNNQKLIWCTKKFKAHDQCIYQCLS